MSLSLLFSSVIPYNRLVPSVPAEISTKLRGVKKSGGFLRAAPLFTGFDLPAPGVLEFASFVVEKKFILRNNGFNVAREDAVNATPISIVLQIAMSVKL
jgi:hypothetical protein